jgi:F0F1-type ATP synthase assembly protein I
MNDSDRKKSNTTLRAVGIASAIGADLVLCMLLGYLLGTYLQEWLGGNPIWLVVGIMLGFIAGVMGLVWLLRYYMEDRNG